MSRNGTEDHEVRFAAVRTARGWAGLAFRGGRLTRLVLPLSSQRALREKLRAEYPAARRADIPRGLRRLERSLVAYFEGRRVDPAALDVPLDLEGETRFRRRVYEALRDVPRGHVVTYGSLARMAGSCGAARGVGGAMAANRLPLVVPCHRVVGAARKLGGFSAAGGVDTKRQLLELEGWDGARFHR